MGASQAQFHVEIWNFPCSRSSLLLSVRQHGMSPSALSLCDPIFSGLCYYPWEQHEAVNSAGLTAPCLLSDMAFYISPACIPFQVVEASAGVGAIGTQQCGYKPSVMGSVSTWGRFLDPQLRLLSLSPHRAGQNWTCSLSQYPFRGIFEGTWTLETS